jgi:parallel beta-helix repeat protein
MPTKLRFRAARAAFVSLAVILGVAVAGVMDSSGGQALASHVSCGDTITADTTLDSDLVNCPNNGIVIGADDITLDLNGHLIDGDGTLFAACPEGEPCDFGVLNDGHDGVTVRDGWVRQFSVGVLVFSARHNRVLDVSSKKNVLFGFVVADSARSLIRNSSGNRNLAPDGDGMGLFGSRHIRIVDNSFRHNPLGIHVDDSTDTLIKRNLLSRNAGFGILMEADRNRVRRNRCARNDACIIVARGSRNVIAQNRVSRGVAGIGLERGRGNLLVRNVVVRTRRTGIYLGLKNPSIGGANNVVRRNRVRGSGGDAFLVNEEDDHSLLKRNIARRAGDDGFDIEGRSTTLTRNRAARSADLGIEALRRVIDGGGNVARHNGDPRQCTHIACN